MRNKNSFTSQVKEELASNSYPSDDRLRALLSAYIRINGSLVFRHKKTLLQLNTENAKIGRFIYETINEIYHANAELIVKEKRNLDKSKSYMIEISDASEAIMDDLEISFLEGKISKNIVILPILRWSRFLASSSKARYSSSMAFLGNEIP